MVATTVNYDNYSFYKDDLIILDFEGLRTMTKPPQCLKQWNSMKHNDKCHEQNVAGDADEVQ